MVTPNFSDRGTYPLAVAIVKGLELHNVGMSDDAHNLEFSILPRVNLMPCVVDRMKTDFETLVLEHTLDRRVLAAWRQLGVEDNTERTIADDLALRVGELSCLSGQAILDLFADNFCKDVSK